MDRFQKCLPRILVHEGGFSNHSQDPGGATNKGVTIGTFRAYYPGASVADLRRISTAQLEHIYRTGYWAKVKADDLPIGVDYIVFDFAVNAGPRRAIKELQQVVGVDDDGAIGPITMAAVMKMEPAIIVDEFSEERLSFYRGLRTWKTFGKGWARRTEEARQLAKEDIAAVLEDGPDKPWGDDGDPFVNPDLPPIPAPKPDPKRTVKEAAEKLDKPAVKSKTNWLTAILGAFGSFAALFTDLDPMVQILILVMIVGAALLIWRERKGHGDLGKQIKAALEDL